MGEVLSIRGAQKRAFLKNVWRLAKGATAAAALNSFLPGCAPLILRGGALRGNVIKIDQNNFLFTAVSRNDPLLIIMSEELGLVNVSLRNKQFLKFEIGGWIRQEGAYARMEVQIYGAADDPSIPSISRRIEVSPPMSTVAIPLEGKIDVLQKVQFLLVTDRGSCELQIRNIRFE
jgi:hypothetical protein